VLASAREAVVVIVAETGEVTGAVAVRIAAAATAKRVRSPRVSRAVRPPPLRVRIARIAVPVAEVTGVAGVTGIGALVAVVVVVASAAVVASASHRGPWWS
jgi:hypothetical protein